MTPTNSLPGRPGDVAVLGLPYDDNSSFMRGPALAPARIRQALLCGASNMTTETGFDLGRSDRWHLLPDLPPAQGDAQRRLIRREVGRLLDGGRRVLSLGGDHSVSYPAIAAHAARVDALTVVQLDAHPDLYDELDGNRFSHATPFARLLEEAPHVRLVQIGIRTLNAVQKAQAERFGVTIVEAWRWQDALTLPFNGPCYLTLDLDVLDPAFAPGISHYEPGGLTTRDLLTLLQQLPLNLVGADIVELNPTRDWSDMTAMVAAKALKELIPLLGASASPAER